ncbi:MAG: HAD family phosphatase [Lachnospiraceae bacterium]|nr:HAD family phosphatase [Lachnospiraceae bacterium]
MKKYRIAALDMDGTMLNSKKEVTPQVQKAMNDALDRGVCVVINSGRNIGELREYWDLFPKMRYVNCVSGALVYDRIEKKAVYEKPLSGELVSAIFDLMEKQSYEVMYHMHSVESIVQKGSIERMKQFNMEHFQKMFRRISLQLDDLREDYLREGFPVYKVNLYHSCEADRLATRKAIREAGLPVVLADSEHTSLEISPEGVTKAAGLAHVAQSLGLSMEDVMCVGDADNDRDALKASGLAVAMGNAKSGIKALCDVTVADCDHDGVAEAIETYCI